MNLLKLLFGKKKTTEHISPMNQKSKPTLTKTDDFNFKDLKEENKKLNDYYEKMYQISLKSRELYDNQKLEEAKTLLENAVFKLDSDTPAHYNLLHEIYYKEYDFNGLQKLKQAALAEIPKKRNKLNGSDKKSTRMVNDIDFSINLESLAMNLAHEIKNNENLNKKQVVDFICNAYDIDSTKANQVYNLSLEKGYIIRQKKNGVFQHFSV
jgi:hypothetical protein